MTKGLRQPLAKLGEDLAAARKRLGLSQAQVASRAGTSQAAVSRIESGSLNPQVSTLIDLVRALELDVRLIPRQIAPALDALELAQEQNARGPLRTRALYELATDEEA